MKKILYIAVLVIAISFITGCPKKPTIVKEEAKAPAVEIKVDQDAKIKAEAEARARKEAEEKAKAEAEAKARKEAEARAKAEADERAKKEAERQALAEAKAKEAFRVEDIQFEFNSYDITTTARETLKNLSDWMSKNKGIKIQIEGHCDERGTTEYNLALGERRANGVKQYLATLGVEAARLSIISYGEEKPLCSESTEECWAKNRRAHFVVKE